MSHFPNEVRILSELEGNVYQLERSLREALNHGAQFPVDFGELYLTVARLRGQIAVLGCKLNALSKPDPVRSP